MRPLSAGATAPVSEDDVTPYYQNAERQLFTGMTSYTIGVLESAR